MKGMMGYYVMLIWREPESFLAERMVKCSQQLDHRSFFIQLRHALRNMSKSAVAFNWNSNEKQNFV
jgi:hypothetical protein